MQAENAGARVLYVDDEPSLLSCFRTIVPSRRQRRGGDRVIAPGSPDDAGRRAVRRHRLGPAHARHERARAAGDGAAARARDAAPARVSGYADFESALDAINEVGVDRMLVKPWRTASCAAPSTARLELARLQRENIRVTAELRRRGEELGRVNQQPRRAGRGAHRNLLDGLVSALDLPRHRDPVALAPRGALRAPARRREIGIAARELDDIERGALLHDIGKIGVRDAVLLKPGPLDARGVGRDAAAPGPGLRDPAAASRSSARAPDRAAPPGALRRPGYPQRLKGEQICSGARIFAVADTYDAITSDRPYRKVQHLRGRAPGDREVAGTQLDPPSSRSGCASRRPSGTRSARRSRARRRGRAPASRSDGVWLAAARTPRSPSLRVQSHAALARCRDRPLHEVFQRRGEQRVAKPEAVSSVRTGMARWLARSSSSAMSPPIRRSANAGARPAPSVGQQLAERRVSSRW